MPAAAPPTIGTKLRRARIERSLSIEETAWRTRIRPDLLRALELEEFDEIGHQAFVRSHLSSYARFLGMDPTELVEEFESLQDGPVPSSIEELNRQAAAARKPPRAKWLVASVISGALLAAAGTVGILGGQAERPLAQAQVPPVEPIATGPAAVPAAEARVRLRFEVAEDVVVSVSADGKQIFDGTLAEDTVRSFNGRDSLEILVANAGAVRLALNGEELGVPGARGEVYRARFGPRGRISD